jgi:hypothetical protein
MVNMLQEYIENNEVLKGKVTVKTNKIGVNGPSYVYGTFKNIDKYAPYQFVKVNVSGEENDEDSDIKMIESKDSELK